MAETDNGAATPAPETKPQVKMNVMAQFIRDLSFENIVAQKGIQGEVNPDIQVQVSLEPKKRAAEGQYEVVTRFNVTSKNKGTEDTLFLLELQYGGIFQIEGVPEEQLHPFLSIECPRMLFPYIRRLVADITREGGFPPLNLDNIDFMQVYRNSLAQRAKAEGSAEEPRPS
ncbi:MAG: protein-export chaperone SecB [Rhodobacteraceae bacterium]|nr:protein-export chaperone SecB [Paracoccaceae bacterium]